VIVESGAKIPAILLHDVGRQLVAFLISVPGPMLFKSFLGCLAGHTYIQTLQHPIELRVRFPKFGAFGKYFFRQFDDVDYVGQFIINMEAIFSIQKLKINPKKSLDFFALRADD